MWRHLCLCSVVAEDVCVVFESAEDERGWIDVHTPQGKVSLCCWYRSPDSGVDNILRFEEEAAGCRHGDERAVRSADQDEV